MVKKFHFWGKTVQKQSLGGRMVSHNVRWLMLRFEAGGGLMKFVSLSLVKMQFAGTQQDTLFMVGFSLLGKRLRPFVAGAWAPGKKGFGIN
jgi:hypothetical protein